MRIGCHGLVWTGVFDAKGIRSATESTRAAGFDLIEYPLMSPSTFDAREARRALDDCGLAGTGSLGLGPETDVASEDLARVRAGRDLLFQAVDRVAEFGGSHLCGVLQSAMRKYGAPATPAAVDNSAKVLSEVVDRGRASGVSVSVEVVNRYESNVFNTGRGALEYIAHSGADLGVHLDTYHMNIEESSMFEPVLDVGDRLRYVHIGESHRGYLGTGSVDFKTFFHALHRTAYDGPVVFESFSSAVVEPTLTSALGIWRNLWDDGADLGAHANSFIRGAVTAARTISLH
ncbi:sugar phosphate isomerase/epimerase family protein [Streptomyces sp. NPDC002276]